MEFGKRSVSYLRTCHSDLQKIMKMAIDLSRVDFGITEGYRSPSRQKQLFDQGLTKIDGINRLGKHNVKPSMAVDIYVYHPDLKTRRKIAYNPIHLSYIAGVIDASAQVLIEKSSINHRVRWGGNWDHDGVIKFDQSFIDMPHFELIKL